jgi:multimeric flavodoxin WrbA
MQTTRSDKLRVLILSGSQRREKDCPGVDSKSRAFMQRMAERLPQEWEIDIEDLGNVKHKSRIQPCNACVSTAMALCVWPCNCYLKNDIYRPDLLWDLDLYARLDLADAWAIIGPVNWYAPSTNLKTLFDRLVCMNGGNPRDDLIDNKDHEKAMALEKLPIWKELSQNHLEGRTAAFFCHGDDGGDELGADGIPKIIASEHKHYFDADAEPFDDMRHAYAPLVWQCRYSGIEVPEQLWDYMTMGKDKKNSDNQIKDIPNDAYAQFDRWTDNFAAFVTAKGKAPVGKFPAYNFDQSPHIK